MFSFSAKAATYAVGSFFAIPGREQVITVTAISDTEATAFKRKNIFDRALDRTVALSGSWSVFTLINLSLVAWALCGIPFGASQTWQVFISDYQALLTYFFDSLLMRQQLVDGVKHLGMYAELRSRQATFATVILLERPLDRTRLPDVVQTDILPDEKSSDKWLTRVSNVFGHLACVVGFWLGVVAWIGAGNSLGWGDEWLLYMNTATSAGMVFLFALLAVVRERHDHQLSSWLESICVLDGRLERTLRSVCTDVVPPNLSVTLSTPPSGFTQRAIDYYANLVSMLFGLVILTAIVVIWAAFGPLMQYSANWWLFIGTYAGLVGMFDGFVLRNIDEGLIVRQNREMALIEAVDGAMRAHLGLGDFDYATSLSLSTRVSLLVSRFFAHRYAVVGGVATVIVLIVAASAMHWNEVGQLLCNVAPSIIETFLMIVLITGHNHAHGEKQARLKRIWSTRVALFQWARYGMKGEKAHEVTPERVEMEIV